MKDENKLKIIGALFRGGYEALKKDTVTSENKTYFDILEACGRGIRKLLEGDPDLKNVYKGSDVVRVGKELYDSIKNTFEDE